MQSNRQIPHNEMQPLNADVTQRIVYFVLLALINMDKASAQRSHIIALACTSKAWNKLMLAPLDVRLDPHLDPDIISNSSLEIMRHRLFARAGIVTLRNNAAVCEDYHPNITKLIYLPVSLQEDQEMKSNPEASPVESDEMLTPGITETPSNKKCYAVGIVLQNGLKNSFETGEAGEKFKVFEDRIDAETYVNSIPQSVMGYTVPPRVIKPITLIQPRKLSSGGIDHALSVQFFKVSAHEMRSANATPTPEVECVGKYSLD